MTHILPATALALAGSFGFADEPTRPATQKPEFVTELARMQKAEAKREKKLYAEYGRRHQGAKTDADREAALRWARQELVKFKKADLPAQVNLIRLLRGSVADPATVPGLCYLFSTDDDALRAESIELLRRHHLTHPTAILAAWGSGQHMPDEGIERLLRDQLAATVPDDQRPRLRYGLAMHLKLKAALPAQIDGDPQGMVDRYGKDAVARLRKADVGKLEAEAVQLFDDLAEQNIPTELAPGVTISGQSRIAAYEIRSLGIGKPAPETTGEDLDGVKFRLSDYKGKVVVLSFWSSACTPCMALVPHEREIVARFKGRPFALIGVNSDEDKGEVKPVLERHQITWRSFWCGPKGGYGELPKVWNVTGWPTVYVIDHTGVIRSKTARGAELDKLLDSLVKKAEGGTQN